MSLRILRSLTAGCLVAAGLATFALGHVWAPTALDRIPDSALGPWLELFVPFLPMALITAGAVTYLPRRSDKTKK